MFYDTDFSAIFVKYSTYQEEKRHVEGPNIQACSRILRIEVPINNDECSNNL